MSANLFIIHNEAEQTELESIIKYMQKSQIYLDLKYDSGAKTYQWADNTDVSQYRHFDDKAKLDGSLQYVTVPTGNDFKMTWMTTNNQQENLIVCQKNPVTLGQVFDLVKKLQDNIHSLMTECNITKKPKKYF